ATGLHPYPTRRSSDLAHRIRRDAEGGIVGEAVFAHGAAAEVGLAFHFDGDLLLTHELVVDHAHLAGFLHEDELRAFSDLRAFFRARRRGGGQRRRRGRGEGGAAFGG